MHEQSGNELYNRKGELVQTFGNFRVEDVIWRPDSAGIFLRVSRKLLYVDLPGGELYLIDDHNPEEITWIGVD